MALKDFINQIPEIKLSEEAQASLDKAAEGKDTSYVISGENHPDVMAKTLAEVANQKEEPSSN